MGARPWAQLILNSSSMQTPVTLLVSHQILKCEVFEGWMARLILSGARSKVMSGGDASQSTGAPEVMRGILAVA